MKASKFSFCSLVQYLITVHSEDEPWAIPFLIPLHDGISETLPLQSDTCWEAPRFSIAEVMDVSSKSLNIGYKFSTHTARDPHHALSTPAHWLELIHEASIENECLNSKGKNRKRFEVHVKSFHAAAKPKSEKGGTKTGKSKGKGTKQARESEEESSEGDEEGTKGDETDWVAQIQARTECGKHTGKHCFVNEAGVHRKLSKQDLSQIGRASCRERV